MARSDPTIYMRIPQELKEKLEAQAIRNRRSITAEVVARLEESFAAVQAPSVSGMQKKELPVESASATLSHSDRLRQEMLKLMSQQKAQMEEMRAVHQEQMRAWWQREFGFDPDAPKVEHPTSKGPVRSHNAKRPKP